MNPRMTDEELDAKLAENMKETIRRDVKSSAHLHRRIKEHNKRIGHLEKVVAELVAFIDDTKADESRRQ